MLHGKIHFENASVMFQSGHTKVVTLVAEWKSQEA